MDGSYSSPAPAITPASVAESLRHNRDRLFIEEAETDIRLEVVKAHRRQFEQILTIHLERIMMSSAAQKSSLFEILTGSPTAVNAAGASGRVVSPSRKAGGGGGGGEYSQSPSPVASARNQQRASTPSARRGPSLFAASPTSCRDVNNLPSARLAGGSSSRLTNEQQVANTARAGTGRSYEMSQESNNSGGRALLGGNRASTPDRVQVTRLFAGASAKSLGRMARVIPMEIPNTSEIRRKQAVYRRLRQDMASEEGNLQDFQASERKRRAAYEASREMLFKRTEDKSLRDRLRHDLAMRRRPPEVGLEQAVTSDAKLMRVEERKRAKAVALQALADSRRQIWSRSAQEVDWAKRLFLDKQREVQSKVNSTVLGSEEQRKRTDMDLNDISIVANIHRRSHRQEALTRRNQIQLEQARLLNLSRAVTERNFESTGITVQTSWEEERPPMPPTGRAAAAAASAFGTTTSPMSAASAAAAAAKEISDTTYDRLCGTPRAPIPKFAGAAEALKHMSSTAWDAMSDLQHDARLRALEFARFHSAGKMPPVSWK